MKLTEREPPKSSNEEYRNTSGFADDDRDWDDSYDEDDDDDDDEDDDEEEDGEDV